MVVAHSHGGLWFGCRRGYGWFLGIASIFGRKVKSVGPRLWQNVAGSSKQSQSFGVYAFPVGEKSNKHQNISRSDFGAL